MPDGGRGGRVIAGRAGGLRLDVPGSGTRPVSDRVKQSLFALLETLRPDPWEGPVLDLFAGSGALGIEALSRGAPRAVLVERDGRAAAVAGRNLERTSLAGQARVVRREVAAFLGDGPAACPEAPFDTVFLDPPYALAAELAAALDRLGASAAPGASADLGMSAAPGASADRGMSAAPRASADLGPPGPPAWAPWLSPDVVVVAKHFWKTPPPERAGTLAVDRVRRFGETALSVYRRAVEPVEPVEPVAGGE